MMRTLPATLLASALVLGTWSATTAATSTVPTEAAGTLAASNQSTLLPGGAAGIKEAQGIESGAYWREAELVIGAFVIVWILMGLDDSDDSTTTTGT
jgi:hypothetical protein